MLYTFGHDFFSSVSQGNRNQRGMGFAWNNHRSSWVGSGRQWGQCTQTLSNLNVSKSPGPDKFHPRVLYVLRDIISKQLAIIFQTSLRSGVLPDHWKRANITAIHKKGSRKIFSLEDCELLQHDVDRLVGWTKNSLLKFHPDKCTFMRIGKTTVGANNYTMGENKH